MNNTIVHTVSLRDRMRSLLDWLDAHGLPQTVGAEMTRYATLNLSVGGARDVVALLDIADQVRSLRAFDYNGHTSVIALFTAGSAGEVQVCVNAVPGLHPSGDITVDDLRAALPGGGR